jgi:hypothetical protein
MLLAAGVACAAAPCVGHAAELTSVAEALSSAFPPPAVTAKRTLYLGEEQAESIARAAGSPLPSRVVTCYVARESSAANAPVIGWACLDTHIVRTLPETLMVVVDTGLRVRRVVVLAFKEPQDYLLSERWLEQLSGHPLEPDLALKRGVRVMSGATLSSRSATRATRRVLALVEQELAPRRKARVP